MAHGNSTALPFQAWTQPPPPPNYDEIYPLSTFTNNDIISSNIFYIHEDFDIRTLNNTDAEGVPYTIKNSIGQIIFTLKLKLDGLHFYDLNGFKAIKIDFDWESTSSVIVVEVPPSKIIGYHHFSGRGPCDLYDSEEIKNEKFQTVAKINLMNSCCSGCCCSLPLGDIELNVVSNNSEISKITIKRNDSLAIIDFNNSNFSYNLKTILFGSLIIKCVHFYNQRLSFHHNTKTWMSGSCKCSKCDDIVV